MSNTLCKTVSIPWYTCAVSILFLAIPLSIAVRDLKAERFIRHANQSQTNNHFDEALSDYREAIKVNPGDARSHMAYAELARTLWIFRDTPELKAEADHAFDNAKRLSPHWAIPHYQHARMYSFKSEFDRALILLAPALELDPNNAGYWLESARYLEKVLNLRKAGAAYSRCWALDTIRECETAIHRLSGEQ